MLDHGSLDYAALSSRCRTKNEFRRLHIDLENTLAPTELREIKKFIDTQDADAPGHGWVGELQKLSPELFEVPQAYQRRSLTSRATLYQDPASDVAERGLLVAFSGDARRLMLPVCVFLQLIDSRRWDVLVLRKNGKTSFLRGLEGVSSSLPGLIRYVQRAVAATRYRRTITLGTSGGGSAAIMAALLMEADRGVSICGSALKLRGGIWLRHRIALGQRKAAAAGRELWYIYGSDCARDLQAARALLDRYGGELYPIPGADEHNVFRWLLERGQLAAFLDGIIE
jgi:hypothetical protein